MKGPSAITTVLVIFFSGVSPTLASSLQQLQAEGRLEIGAELAPQGDKVPGQRLTLTLTVATDRWFTGGTRIRIPEVPGLVILQTEQFASNTSESRGDKTWVTQRWALDVYAQRSGEFTIPPIPLELQINTGGTDEVRGQSEAPGLRFKTVLPVGLKEIDHWVAAPRFEVKQRFDRSLEGLQVGDAFERDIRFEAEDVMAMMLPALEQRSLAGLATYPSPPQLQNASNRGQTRAVRREKITYIVEQAGVYRLPQQEFFWWDTTQEKLRVVSLPEVSIKVGGQSTQPAPGAPVDNERYLLPAVVLLILTAFTWLLYRGTGGSFGARLKRGYEGLRERWRRLRAPALADELNPGNSAAERKASL